ncbi:MULTISPECIES: hypothetical protein [Prosthecochloris]|uniref:hypothetical protein n=1 Tax=Prosthecochloris TaxID=1101 RepID=UPI0012947F49|nr:MULTISPECIES: hypothetical protein [Prosthecochloris]UZJ39329.1 hypothetical protein OO185_05205 [Prosthecochloris sp. SCSIO W1102]
MEQYLAAARWMTWRKKKNYIMLHGLSSSTQLAAMSLIVPVTITGWIYNLSCRMMVR